MRKPQKIENIHKDLQQIANNVAPDIVEYIRARVKVELDEYKLAPGYTDELARDVIAQICYCAIKV